MSVATSNSISTDNWVLEIEKTHITRLTDILSQQYIPTFQIQNTNLLSSIINPLNTIKNRVSLPIESYKYISRIFYRQYVCIDMIDLLFHPAIVKIKLAGGIFKVPKQFHSHTYLCKFFNTTSPFSLPPSLFLSFSLPPYRYKHTLNHLRHPLWTY